LAANVAVLFQAFLDNLFESGRNPGIDTRRRNWRSIDFGLGQVNKLHQARCRHPPRENLSKPRENYMLKITDHGRAVVASLELATLLKGLIHDWAASGKPNGADSVCRIIALTSSVAEAPLPCKVCQPGLAAELDEATLHCSARDRRFSASRLLPRLRSRRPVSGIRWVRLALPHAA